MLNKSNIENILKFKIMSIIMIIFVVVFYQIKKMNCHGSQFYLDGDIFTLCISMQQ